MKAAGKTYILRIGSTDFEVTRKNVKRLSMRVGADGTIRVSAPYGTPIAFVEAFIVANQGWVEKARAKASSRATRAPHDGGRFMLWGEPLTLRVVHAEKRSRAPYVQDGELIVTLSLSKDTAAGLEKACSSFLAEETKRALEGAISRMEERTSVHADGWRVRSMTSRWGSCNVQKRTITINSQLAHYPARCLDYVVCHELCHLIEPSHNARFHALMDRFYPGWKDVRKELRG